MNVHPISLPLSSIKIGLFAVILKIRRKLWKGSLQVVEIFVAIGVRFRHRLESRHGKMMTRHRKRNSSTPPKTVAKVAKVAEINLKDDEAKILELLNKDSQVEEQDSQVEEPMNAPFLGLVCVNQSEVDDLIGIPLELENADQGRIPTPVADADTSKQVTRSPTSSIGSYQLDSESDVVEINTEDEQVDFSAAPATPKRKTNFRGRGKPLDPVWQNFISLPNLLTKAKCKYCSDNISNKVERLRNHIAKCSAYASVSRRQVSVPEENGVRPALFPPSAVIGSPKLTSKQGKLTVFVDRMNKAEQEEMDMEIGRYIFSINLPFSHVEHPGFLRLMSVSRPAYRIPSRRSVGNSILNKTYVKVVQEQNKQMKGKFVTILQDGWKSRTSEPIIAHSMVIDGKSVFLNAIGTEENKKSSKYCAGLLSTTLDEVTAKGAEVIAVVTDNCSSMEKMRRLLSEKYPNIFTYGCQAHLFNLVGKKFTPEDVMEKVQMVHTYFRNHDAAAGILKKTIAPRPILPSATRWNAWQDCFEYYIDHHTKLLQTSRNPKASVDNEEIISILNDNQFYAQVKKTALYMKPIQVALDLVQREGALLADGVDAWLKVRKDLVIEDEELKTYFNKQFNRALQPVGIAAYMFHPKYRGEGLEPALLEIGSKFLSDQFPFFSIIAAQLREKNDRYFSPHMFLDDVVNNCSPSDWWISQKCLEKVQGNAVEFAVKLNQLPAGSADIERHFSTLGNIMSVRRARLGIEKASKLCVIYKYFANVEPPIDDGGDWDIPDYE